MRRRAVHRDDAVLLGVLPRHHLHAEHAGVPGLVDLRHLCEAGDVAANEIIRQMHEEGLGAHGGLRAEHRMTEPEGRRLPDIDAGGVGRQDAAQLVEQIALALLLER